METLTELLFKKGMKGRILSTSVITNLVQGSPGRRWGLVHRALKSGELIQLKRGLYVLDPSLTEQETSTFTIANRLIAESYVSMESALGYHGWLQEELTAVQSCIPEGRTRRYRNQFGEFIYRSVPNNGSDFYLGVRREESEQNYFLIAGPERAMGDTLLSRKPRWQGITGLCSSLRIDIELLDGMDLNLLKELSSFYRSPELRHYLRNLQSALGGER